MDIVHGKFAQRGDEKVTNLEALVDLAQANEVLDLIRLGSAGNNFVGVAVLKDNNYPNGVHTVMTYWGLYEFSSFRSEKYKQAYDNMCFKAVQLTGAYSNTYKVY